MSTSIRPFNSTDGAFSVAFDQLPLTDSFSAIEWKKGMIHSFESFGTKDGPGVRFVLFMQGCPLRCLYCHNPDTWKIGRHSYELSACEAFEEIRKVKTFIRHGGVTVSGGEPMLQPDFVRDLFALCKEEGLHTAVDTSGFIMNDKVKEVLSLTDLVLLDIKHIHPERYKILTSRLLKPTLQFVDYLQKIGKSVWVRYVLVPGYSDNEQDLHHWAEYVARYDIVKRVDVLPFHQMGKHKWKTMGINYKLENVSPASPELVGWAERIFKQYGLPLAI